MNGKEPKFETLSQKAKKKKNFLIVIAIVGIISFLVISILLAFVNTDKEKTFKEQPKESNINSKEFNVIRKADVRETWAQSTENKIETLKENLTEFKATVKEENQKNITEIKNILLDAQAKQSQKLEEQKEEMNKSISTLKNSMETTIAEQNQKIEELSLKGGVSIDGESDSEKTDEEIVLGEDLLPDLEKEQFKKKTEEDEQKAIEDSKLNKPSTPEELKKDELASNPEENKPIEQKAIIEIVELDTTSNQEDMKKEEELLKEYNSLKEKTNDNYHVMIGLSQAYMITGAYAPAFDSGEEEPLPVLLQAEGDILIANDDTQSIDKCMLIGTAKGNMNSQTADIRLIKIACSLADGTKKIEGDIQGWVIGENGIPGVQGELLHKNGAWLSRTFLSGFLQTFSSSLGNTDSTQITIGTDTGTGTTNLPIGTAMTDNAKSAAAGGLSNVFGKIGDYYLKMAEQIFPVIEVKGGRTVNILLKGGEDLQVTDFNKLELEKINDVIEEKRLAEEKLTPMQYIELKKQEQEESSKEDNQSSKTGNTEQTQNNKKGFPGFDLKKLEGK